MSVSYFSQKITHGKHLSWVRSNTKTANKMGRPSLLNGAFPLTHGLSGTPLLIV